MNQPQPFDAPIELYNRHTRQVETESVYGEGFLRWAYGNPLGRLTVELAVKRLWFSKWYGWRMDRPASRAKVAPFVKDYGVDVGEFADPVESYQTFNEFFYRKLKPEARPIAAGKDVAVFPADGRHLAIQDVNATSQFYIKGQQFDLDKFLGDPALAKEFEGGSVLISRLCPVDYHRYHFSVSGNASGVEILAGSLRSVSPWALRRKLAILWENRRARTIVDSPDFGKVIVIEVGATCVGGMHSTFNPGVVEKGGEKGYFSFGGSCVTTIFKRGSIQFDDDLNQHAAEGREVRAKMGERCGVTV
ncbi:MAG: phosphatidylserine decarboxylase [Lentimonas sp.]